MADDSVQENKNTEENLHDINAEFEKISKTRKEIEARGVLYTLPCLNYLKLVEWNGASHHTVGKGKYLRSHLSSHYPRKGIGSTRDALANRYSLAI